MSAWILCCIILEGQHSGPTGRHRPPGVLAQNHANLLKSMLPPAPECQIASMSAWILCCIILKGQHSGPTGRHRPPGVLVQNHANLLKSVLPPAPECQIAYLRTLATPVEPKGHQGLAAYTRADQMLLKCNPHLQPTLLPNLSACKGQSKSVSPHSFEVYT